jgi:hypothetical protein
MSEAAPDAAATAGHDCGSTSEFEHALPLIFLQECFHMWLMVKAHRFTIHAPRRDMESKFTLPPLFSDDREES